MKSSIRSGMFLRFSLVVINISANSFTRMASSITGGMTSIISPVNTAPTTMKVLRMPKMRNFMRHLYWKNFTSGNSR